MNKKEIKQRLEYKTKDLLYKEFISNKVEFVLDVLEQNYLASINFYTNCVDGDYLRRKVLKNINFSKLKKIIPKYIKNYKKYGMDLIPLTNKIQKEIWEEIKTCP